MLRDRSLLGLLTAELVSLTGSSMTFVALPWFVLTTTGSAAKMGWVLAAEMLPLGLFGIPAGALIARLGAKRAMLVADAARCPLLLLLPLLLWGGHLSFEAVLVCAFAAGSFSALYLPSSRLIIPEVTGDDEHAVARVGAVLGGASQLTQVVGPVLGGVLIAATSAATALVADSATYAFSFATIAAAVRAGRPVPQTRESRGVLAGLRFLRRDSLLGPAIASACTVNALAQGLIVGVNALAYFHYGADPRVAGILFGGFGVGAVLGAVAAQQCVRKHDLLQLAAAGLLAMPLPLFALAFHVPWPAAMLALGMFGFFIPLVNAPLLGVVAVRTPEALRPKVMATAMTVATFAGPLGFFTAGMALRWISVHMLFLCCASGLTAGAIAFAAVLLRGATRQAEQQAAASV